MTFEGNDCSVMIRHRYTQYYSNVHLLWASEQVGCLIPSTHSSAEVLYMNKDSSVDTDFSAEEAHLFWRSTDVFSRLKYLI